MILHRSSKALSICGIVVGFIILIFLSNVAYQFCSNLPVTNDYIVVFASFWCCDQICIVAVLVDGPRRLLQHLFSVF
jgi:hypothetical protein